MPIRIPMALPAYHALREERVFVMTNERAEHQDIRPLKVGIVNLMPTTLDTELQLLRLLGNSPLQVDISFLRMGTHEAKNAPPGHLERFYQNARDVMREGRRFDGLIVTGAPVETLPFEEVDYWDELSALLDYSTANVWSTLHICWGAQAALYHRYGVPKRALPKKLFGIFPHRVNRRNTTLFRGFDDEFPAPQSRHTESDRAAVAACRSLQIVSETPETGVFLAVARDGREIYVSGHLEYDSLTLDREYRRDLEKGVSIDIPKNYYPGDDPRQKPVVHWRAHAHLFFSNWLNYVYQETPYSFANRRSYSFACCHIDGSSSVYTWITRFLSLERGQTPKSFRLERMEALADLAGRPERCAPVIHVAGSKGKGSVTALIASALQAGGLRTARYTSPHVRDFRERLTWGDGAFFDEEVYVEAGKELKALVQSLSGVRAGRWFDPAEPEGERPTYFELMTLYFFLCARAARCDFMVVETGMGGRLDSTNIVDPLVSVITGIELEHTRFLGDTLAAIAGEKAGIIKEGRPLVLAEQAPAALEVFRRTATERQAPLSYFPEKAELKGVRVGPQGTSFRLRLKDGEAVEMMEMTVPVPGAIQAANGALAALALAVARPGLGAAAVREGFAGFRLPARFELVRETPPLVIDGAHTPRSVALCIETFVHLYGHGGVLLFGCAADKDAAGMARAACGAFSRVIVTRPGSLKKSSPEAVYRAFCEAASCPVECVPDPVSAVALLREAPLPALVTGSFYLAAEVRP